ncbi:PREDICTED: uncharacterized protein LOC106557257 [Thamnophis sirtalis]|uniref:Uncharacterized protein LOC106557257 n=1 Tax=Thamnophis sirtalis TaxID=35019 RepID=A0A6I9Z7T6_9SAUR|nr:PREDICTED: uncharacterized protein LOC106557257 [Thamnophis sirtalis]
MDPLDSWEKKPLEKQQLQERCPPPTSGDSRHEGLLGGGGGGGDQATERPADFHKDREIPRVHLFLPPVGASKLYRKKIKVSKRSIWVPPGESTQLRKITLPAIQPQFQMPLLFSKTNLQNHAPLQEKRPAESERRPEEASWGPPTASSPDFQLPTQLLLQKLQETTTSHDHLLIAKVLRSLREELLGSKSDQREKQEDFLELPRIQSWKHGKRDMGEKAFDATDMETAKNRLIRLIRNHNSFPQGTGVLQVAPGP